MRRRRVGLGKHIEHHHVVLLILETLLACRTQRESAGGLKGDQRLPPSLVQGEVRWAGVLRAKLIYSYPTLWTLWTVTPQAPVHGIFQARILE